MTEKTAHTVTAPQRVTQPVRENRCSCGAFASPSGLCPDCARSFPAFSTPFETEGRDMRRWERLSGDSGAPNIQRKLKVFPKSEVEGVVADLNIMVPSGQFVVHSKRPRRIVSRNCDSKNNPIIKCTEDNQPRYRIHVENISAEWKKTTLADGSECDLPYPSSQVETVGRHIYVPTKTSKCRFGFFDSAGKPHVYERWRMIAHELGGHAISGLSHSPGRGDRADHDPSIQIENNIAAGVPGSIMRGCYDTPRQGECFFKADAADEKMAYRLKDGWHYDAASNEKPVDNECPKK